MLVVKFYIFAQKVALDDYEYFDNERHNTKSSEPMILSSFIRGYHIYKKHWPPLVGDILSCLSESDNKYDQAAAVAVMSHNQIAGHVPTVLSGIFTKFLLTGSISAKVTGSLLDRGYGLEVPTDYIFYGNKECIDELVADISHVNL